MVSSWPESGSVGQRMVVRHRTGETAPSGRPELTDVLGHLRSVGPDAVQIERRDGSLVTVQRTDVVAWKPVPEPPQRAN